MNGAEHQRSNRTLLPSSLCNSPSSPRHTALLPGSKGCSQHSPSTHANNSNRKALLSSPFYRWGDWGRETEFACLAQFSYSMTELFLLSLLKSTWIRGGKLSFLFSGWLPGQQVSTDRCSPLSDTCHRSYLERKSNTNRNLCTVANIFKLQPHSALIARY